MCGFILWTAVQTRIRTWMTNVSSSNRHKSVERSWLKKTSY
jgi:hypothetical protein